MAEHNLENESPQKSPETEVPEPLTLANLASEPGDLDILSATRLQSRNEIYDDGVSDKLGRQARVLGGGLMDGTSQGLKDALSEPATILKAGASVGVGALLTYMSARKGNMRLAAQGTGIALGGVFAKDLYDHSLTAGGILKDSWNSPANEEADRERMASALGPLATDTIIYTAGGLAGVRYAHNKWGNQSEIGAGLSAGEESFSFMGTVRSKLAALTDSPGSAKAKPKTEAARIAEEPAYVEFLQREMSMAGFEAEAVAMTRIPADAPLAQAVSRSRNSVGKIESLALGEEGLSGSMATAVSISRDGKLVTNQHQIEDAISIVVFDPKGNPHGAHVLKTGDVKDMDLALLQLDKPSSYSAFEPIKIAEARPDNNDMIALLGHSDGLNTMHVSRGTYSGVARTRGHFYQCNANVAAGNCGSAMVNMQGELMGIMKGDIGNSRRGVLAIPAEHIKTMLASAEAPRPNTVTAPRGRLAETVKPHEVIFKVDDPVQAERTVDTIFGLSTGKDIPADFFHQRARVTNLSGEAGSGDLILGTTMNLANKEISVQPLALNGKAIGVTEKWPGLDMKLSDAELKLSFADGQVRMRSINDPLGILQKGLELKGRQPSYLSTLEPASVSPAKTIEPVVPDASNLVGPGAPKIKELVVDYVRGTASNGISAVRHITMEDLAR